MTLKSRQKVGDVQQLPQYFFLNSSEVEVNDEVVCRFFGITGDSCVDTDTGYSSIWDDDRLFGVTIIQSI